MGTKLIFKPKFVIIEDYNKMKPFKLLIVQLFTSTFVQCLVLIAIELYYC